MKIIDFKILKKIKICGKIKYRIKNSSYLETIIDSNIPFKPGVYLMYGVKNKKELELLYFGKAGANSKNELNAHPLPLRLLAPEPILSWHPKFCHKKKKFLTRTKLMEDKVVHDNFDGLNIYWFQTYPKYNCVSIEKELKKEWLEKNKKLPLWMKR